MKKIIILVLFVNLPLFASDCFQFDKAKTEMEWTAYKTTEKVGVPGTFDKITWSQKVSNSEIDLLKTIAFTIDTKSVNSKNSLRDKRLFKSFFKLLKSNSISGKVQSINKEKVSVELTLNGVSKIEEFVMTKNEDKYELVSKIDLINYTTNEALKALNKACFDLHKGKDGVSKTWSEVGLKVTSLVKTIECKK